MNSLFAIGGLGHKVDLGVPHKASNSLANKRRIINDYEFYSHIKYYSLTDHVEHTKFSVKLIMFLSDFSGITAYAAILGILLACGLGVPIPEDITLIAAGILAALGN